MKKSLEQYALIAEIVGAVAWHKVLDGVVLNKRELEIMSDALYAHLMVLEETYNKHQEGYLDDLILTARVALIESKILWSPFERI